MTYDVSGNLEIVKELEAKIDHFGYGDNLIELKADLSICGFGDNLPEYAGPYEITPKVSEQILDTADKRMSDNLRILSIPMKEVTNSSNGKTIYIG